MPASRTTRRIAVTLLAIALPIASLPYLTTTTTGKDLLVATINKKIHGTLEIESLQTGWLSPTTIHNLSLKDTFGTPLATAEEIGIETSLLQILFSKKPLAVRLQHPQALLAFDGHNTTNWQKLFNDEPAEIKEKSAQSDNATTKRPLRLDINKGHITITSPTFDTITIHDLNLSLIAPSSNAPLDLTLAATTKQGNTSGTLSLQASLGPNAQDPITLEGKLLDIPTEALDALIATSSSLPPIAAQALGTPLNLSFQGALHDGNATIATTLQAPNLVANLQGESSAATLTLAKESRITWTATPEFIHHLNPALTLTKATTATVDLQGAQIDLSATTPLPLGTAHIAITPTTLQGLPVGDIIIKSLGIDLSAKEKNLTATCSLSSNILDTASFALSWEQGKSLLLASPTALSCLLPKNLLATSGMSLAEDLSLTLEIADFSLPIAPLSLAKASCHLVATTPTATLITPYGSWEARTIALSLSGNTLATSQADLVATLSPKGPTPTYLAPLGTPIALKSTLHMQEGDNNLPMPGKQELSLSTPTTHLQALGNWHLPDIFALSAPLQITTTAVAPLLAPLLKDTGWALLEASPLTFTLAPQAIPLADPFSTPLVAKASLALPHALITTASTTLPLADTSLAIEVNLPENLAVTTLQSTLPQNLPASLNITATTKNLFSQGTITLDSATTESRITCTDLPTTLLAPLAGIPPDILQDLIGPTAKAVATIHLPKTTLPQGTASLYIDTQNLQASASLKRHDTIALESPSTPATCDFTLTPQGYKALQSLLVTTPSPLELQKPAQGTLQITALEIPPTPLKDLPRIAASLELSQLLLANTATHIDTSLEAFKAYIDTTKSSPLHLDIAIQRGPKGHLLPAGTLALEGTIVGWQSQDPTFHADLSVKGIAPKALGELLSISPEAYRTLVAACGTYIDMLGHIALNKMQGPLRLDIHTGNATASLDAQITKDLLLLNSPFTASITLTPELAETLFANINPMLATAASAESPIKALIDPSGFSLPLTAPYLSAATIGNARVDIGKITCQNTGVLEGLTTFLKAPKKQMTDLWFSPLYLAMKDTIVTCKRVDILVNGAAHIATWGTINGQKEYVDMTLGIAQETVAATFHVRDLPKDYMLQIPLKGKFGKTSADFSQALAQITTLSARKLGLGGKIFGTITDAIGIGTSAPPPTTSPFPWE